MFSHRFLPSGLIYSCGVAPYDRIHRMPWTAAEGKIARLMDKKVPGEVLPPGLPDDNIPVASRI